MLVFRDVMDCILSVSFYLFMIHRYLSRCMARLFFSISSFISVVFELSLPHFFIYIYPWQGANLFYNEASDLIIFSFSFLLRPFTRLFSLRTVRYILRYTYPATLSVFYIFHILITDTLSPRLC
eukprot:TRINITY_DN7917_c0_g1::TRINITY_DN7917_c0_g1_i1::g.15541::m.15541 TRINITY_DN7917_c0_g1::TRINITY_DN7917_c0_g1_i1::g.15541  ORF type:complete len:124 (-),score=-24.02,S-antigen/PF05756.6/0.17,S-antigen/PF05756.6/91 TRINITY_DN7917_c0_g1_i1:274-645(-)